MSDQNDDLAAELDAWLADEDPERSYQPPERIELDPKDERQVNAMLRKRARLKGERARISGFAADQVAAMLAWESDRVRGIDDQLAWLERGLEQFTRATLPPLNRRSLPLPSGVLKLTAPGAPSLVVDDLGDFVAWATDEKHPERDALLRREVNVEKADAKRAFHLGPKNAERSDAETLVFAVLDEHDATVPGLSMTKPAQDRFTVTPVVHDEPTPDKESEG